MEDSDRITWLAITIILYFGFFFSIYAIAYTMFMYTTARLDERTYASRAISSGVNAASLTTTQRKKRTLDNPVGRLNGQQVYINVSTNPAR
jgi:hypothetical protein